VPLGRRIPSCPTLLLFLLLTSCSKPHPLPIFDRAPEFQLTTQSGDTFDSHSLAGHVWVADFFYTTCPGPCPMMTRQMRQLQDSTAGPMGDVEMVSFTVDPAHDTPPVLADYARHYRVDPARWRFLTGDLSRLNAVGLAFKLNTVDGNLDHSTRFVLVDRRGRVRGYYATSEDGFLPRLTRDIRQLERDPS
jgi:protein SCO1/2